MNPNNKENYKKKYLKYKAKYLKLSGGEINYACNNEEKNYMCPHNTVNVGLCVSANDSKICNNPDYNILDVELPTVKNITDEERTELDSLKSIGVKKGYVEDYLLKPCYKQSKTPTVYENAFEIPNKEFSIITLNAMGIYRGSSDVLNLMKKRMELLQKEILELKPDILCFQEMSQTSFNELYTGELAQVYKFYYERDLSVIDSRKKDIEVFVISKYPIKKVTIYQLEGNLEYSNSLGVYEFGNLIVFNSYLQAGSKKSPGQKYKASHYSRCRIHELLFINSIIEKLTSGKDIPVILLGDFNFDLNGSVEEWAEIEHLRNLKLNDSWIDFNKGLDIKIGNTEETDINTMRWNNKFEEKHFRYDAILYKNLKCIKSSVICNKPYLLTEAALIESYEQSIISKDKVKDDRIKKTDGKYELFISDHFGVFSQFTF